MFPDKYFASSPRCGRFRPGRVFIQHGTALQRLKPHDAALKIKDDAKISQEVSAEDAALLNGRGLVDRFKIEDSGVDVLARVCSDRELRQQSHLYVFRNSRGPNDTHSAFLNESLRLVEGGQFLRQNGGGSSGVENEIKRPLDSFDGHLAAEKATRSSSHRNLNSRACLGRGAIIILAGAADDACEISPFATTLAVERHAARPIINCRYQASQSRHSQRFVHPLLSSLKMSHFT